MPPAENDDLRTQFAELRTDVRHILTAVTDIKTDLRTTNERFDKLRDDLSQKVDKLKDSLHSSRIWAFGLYGSLLFLLARGFKWL